MKNLVRFLFIILALFACSEKAEQLPVVSFDNFSGIDLDHKIPLDSLVERTDLIQFTADSGLIIGNISLVYESKDHYYLVADNQIMQFNKNGQLTNLIGREGRGPGEYVGVREMAVDELNQQIYVMDYFGRKMLRYNFDGSFNTAFELPSNFGIAKFGLYQRNILYYSSENSVIPAIFLFNPITDELNVISTSDRETLPGEAFMGITCEFGDKENLFLFHYFNDTVYSLVDSHLKPAYLLKFGNLKIPFDELDPLNGKSPDGPRAQVFIIVQGDQFTFIRYSVTRLNGNRGLTFLTGIYRNDFEEYSPSVSFINTENPLFNIETGTEFYAGYDNSLLTIVHAVDALQRKPDLDISENDNSILLKYYLK